MKKCQDKRKDSSVEETQKRKFNKAFKNKSNSLKVLTKRAYDKVHDFFFGCAIVELNGKFGFINENGDEMCEIKYDYMSNFNELGFAQIRFPGIKFDRTYWIDSKGKEYYAFYDYDEIFPLN